MRLVLGQKCGKLAGASPDARAVEEGEVVPAGLRVELGQVELHSCEQMRMLKVNATILRQAVRRAVVKEERFSLGECRESALVHPVVSLELPK